MTMHMLYALWLTRNINPTLKPLAAIADYTAWIVIAIFVVLNAVMLFTREEPAKPTIPNYSEQHANAPAYPPEVCDE